MKQIILFSVLLLSANIASAQLTAFEKTARFSNAGRAIRQALRPYDWKNNPSNTMVYSFNLGSTK